MKKRIQAQQTVTADDDNDDSEKDNNNNEANVLDGQSFSGLFY